MQHRTSLPFLLKLLDGQAFEQFLFSFEIVIHHRDEQALAESARAAKEIVLSALNELIHQCRLVRIVVTVSADGFEVLDANGIFHKPQEFSAKVINNS